MAHFAKLDENKTVIEVIVVNNQVLLDPNGIEREELGIAFLIAWSGGHPRWRQTSYNGTFRKNYAGIGYTYDVAKDAFVPPQPFASWVLDDTTCQWQPPVAMPTDGNQYTWNEDTLSWDLFSP